MSACALLLLAAAPQPAVARTPPDFRLSHEVVYAETPVINNPREGLFIDRKRGFLLVAHDHVILKIRLARPGTPAAIVGFCEVEGGPPQLPRAGAYDEETGVAMIAYDQSVLAPRVCKIVANEGESNPTYAGRILRGFNSSPVVGVAINSANRTAYASLQNGALILYEMGEGTNPPANPSQQTAATFASTSLFLSMYFHHEDQTLSLLMRRSGTSGIRRALQYKPGRKTGSTWSAPTLIAAVTLPPVFNDSDCAVALPLQRQFFGPTIADGPPMGIFKVNDRLAESYVAGVLQGPPTSNIPHALFADPDGDWVFGARAAAVGPSALYVLASGGDDGSPALARTIPLPIQSPGQFRAGAYDPLHGYVYLHDVKAGRIVVLERIAPTADLSVTLTNARTARRGAAVSGSAHVSVKNNALEESAPINVRLYLSLDTILDESDHLLGRERIVGALNPFQTSTLAMGGRADGVVSGTYHLIAVVDPNRLLSDVDLSNNVAVSEPFDLPASAGVLP